MRVYLFSHGLFLSCANLRDSRWSSFALGNLPHDLITATNKCGQHNWRECQVYLLSFGRLKRHMSQTYESTEWRGSFHPRPILRCFATHSLRVFLEHDDTICVGPSHALWCSANVTKSTPNYPLEKAAEISFDKITCRPFWTIFACTGAADKASVFQGNTTAGIVPSIWRNS